MEVTTIQTPCFDLFSRTSPMMNPTMGNSNASA